MSTSPDWEKCSFYGYWTHFWVWWAPLPSDLLEDPCTWILKRRARILKQIEQRSPSDTLFSPLDLMCGSTDSTCVDVPSEDQEISYYNLFPSKGCSNGWFLVCLLSFGRFSTPVTTKKLVKSINQQATNSFSLFFKMWPFCLALACFIFIWMPPDEMDVCKCLLKNVQWITLDMPKSEMWLSSHPHICLVQ